MPVTDENGNAVSGELFDYKTTEVSPCPWGVNDRKFLIRQSADMTPEQAEALRSQGVAVADAAAEPAPANWMEAIDQRLNRALTKALEPITKLFASKGSDQPMANQTPAAPANAQRNEAPAGADAHLALTDEDWTAIDTKIDEKVAAALEPVLKRIDTLEAAGADDAEGSTEAGAEQSAGQAQQSAPAASPTASLEDVVRQQATQISQLTALVEKGFNARPAGNAESGGSTPEAAAAKKSVWAGSPAMSAATRVN